MLSHIVPNPNIQFQDPKIAARRMIYQSFQDQPGCSIFNVRTCEYKSLQRRVAANGIVHKFSYSLRVIVVLGSIQDMTRHRNVSSPLTVK